MTWEYQSEVWLYYGLSDLYFSFHCDDWVFDHHSAFFSIMALEKHLKGLLIYANKGSNSDSDEAIQKASLKMAIGYKHNFVSMTKEADTFIGGKRLHSVLNRNHGGYHGEELLKVLRSAYMETRYPTSIPVAKSFPAGKHIYHDPLSSSGLSDFVRIMCGTITQHLIDKLDVKKVYNNVSQQYSHLESFSRFKNIYMPALWPDESK